MGRRDCSRVKVQVLAFQEALGLSLNVLLSGRHRKKLDTVTLLASAGLER